MQDVLFFSQPLNPEVLAAGKDAIDWGLGVKLTVRLQRLPRRKCSVCGLRRVCFALAVESITATLQGSPCCAEHAGIRQEGARS